jgi:hypothetical protein
LLPAFIQVFAGIAARVGGYAARYLLLLREALFDRFQYSGEDGPAGWDEFSEGETVMAETIEKAKKAKAPAKPRATAATSKKPTAKKQTVAEKVTATTPTHDEIALLALQYWAARGRQHGQDQADWLRAEQELMKMAS